MSSKKTKESHFPLPFLQHNPVENCSTLLSSKFLNYVAFWTFSRSIQNLVTFHHLHGCDPSAITSCLDYCNGRPAGLPVPALAPSSLFQIQQQSEPAKAEVWPCLCSVQNPLMASWLAHSQFGSPHSGLWGLGPRDLSGLISLLTLLWSYRPLHYPWNRASTFSFCICPSQCLEQAFLR